MPKRSPENGGSPILATYLGGTAAACGTASTAITVPTGATSAMLRAAGAAGYYAINGASAGTTSPGYVPQDQVGYIPPVDNLAALHVAGASAAAVVHVQFYQD
jgi:hypothetical protein